jgi:hypothetical protein
MSMKERQLLNKMVMNDMRYLGPTGTLKLMEGLIDNDLSHLDQNVELLAAGLYEELKAQGKLAPLTYKPIMYKEKEVPLALSLNDLL